MASRPVVKQLPLMLQLLLALLLLVSAAELAAAGRRCDKYRYDCGPNASPKPKQNCYDSWYIDCKCDPGYEKSRSQRKCVDCTKYDTSAKCGSFAEPKPGHKCYDSWYIDCECNPGWKKDHQNKKCVAASS